MDSLKLIIILKNFLTIFMLSFILFNCKSKEEEKSDKIKKIMSNCLSALKETNEIYLDSTYIINPYCGEFEFNSYTNRFYSQYGGSRPGSKNEVFQMLKWNDSTFNFKKKEIDLKYSIEPCYNQIAQELSNGISSPWLITFSGIDYNLVFLECIRFYEPITFKDIDENDEYLKRPRLDVTSLAIILKNEEVVDYFIDNTITR